MKINEIINEGRPGLWDNINAKRKRGEKMRKKGAEGAPTEKALKAAQAGSKNESVEEIDESCWDTHKQVGMKTKGGRKVPNCVPKEGVAEATYNPDTFVGKKGTYKGYGITQEGPYQWGISSSARKFPTLNAAKRHIDKNLVAEQGVAGKGSQLEETYHDDDEFFEAYGVMEYNDEIINEAEYQGRKVALNKPMQGDVKKFKVYTKNEKGNVVKVNFGDPNSTIKKNNPARRKSFRARHNCDNPGPKTGARYWSCRKW